MRASSRIRHAIDLEMSRLRRLESSFLMESASDDSGWVKMAEVDSVETKIHVLRKHIASLEKDLREISFD